LGGGFGVPYFPNDRRLDLSALAPALERVCDRLRAAFPGVTLRVELGRYIVAEAGVYLTRVIDRKISRGKTYLVTDGGLHHQLAASGNFGQRIRRNFPVAAASPARGPQERVSVVGCLCTPLDLLADDVMLPALGPGDLVAIFQAGAYGLTASPTAFLGHEPPAELLV
jgi:diaminopimelate decarboxylase